ncbi:hypothetical protein TNCV_2758231 [Trichonephila clavipes]|nr:hypothetical protein TNCV_2758231 [Trichonephila clavipes]
MGLEDLPQFNQNRNGGFIVCGGTATKSYRSPQRGLIGSGGVYLGRTGVRKRRNLEGSPKARRPFHYAQLRPAGKGAKTDFCRWTLPAQGAPVILTIRSCSIPPFYGFVDSLWLLLMKINGQK